MTDMLSPDIALSPMRLGLAPHPDLVNPEREQVRAAMLELRIREEGAAFRPIHDGHPLPATEAEAARIRAELDAKVALARKRGALG